MDFFDRVDPGQVADAHPLLQLLVLLAILAAGFVTLLKVREDRRIRDIAMWLRTSYPAHWERLPWITRTADRRSAVEAFRRDPDFDDPELEQRLAEARRTHRLQAIGLAVAVGALVLAVVVHQALNGGG